MSGEIIIDANFTGFDCQVQHGGNDQLEWRDGMVALRVCAMPDGEAQILLVIGHADGVTNCAVLNRDRFMKLTQLLTEAARQAAVLESSASEGTAQ